MKSNLLLLLLVAIALSACQEKASETILSGILPDTKNGKIGLVKIENYYPGLNTEQILATTETDSLGHFKFKVENFEGGFYQVINNNYPKLKYDIYLEAGDSIYIEQSPWQDTPVLSISGDHSDWYTHLEEDYLLFPKDKLFYDTIKSDGFETAMVFKSFMDSIRDSRLSNIREDDQVPPHLRSKLLSDIQAEHAMFLLEHLERRNYYMGNEFAYFHPEDTYYSFLKNLNDIEENANSTPVKELAKVFLNNQARTALKELDDEKWWEDNLSWKFDQLKALPKNAWTDQLTLSLIQEFSMGLMIDDFFDDLSSFNNIAKEHFTNQSSYQLFNQNSKDFMKLAPGELAPDFALRDSQDNLVRLSDFRGKIVYIDFWGTWCYPCIQDIPDALKLQEAYKDKPIEFLYVALEYDDKNIENWKNFIAGKDKRFGKYLDNKPFPGTHLVAEKQFRNEEIQPYKINFAPTYVLVDPNGKIVSPRAKRAEGVVENFEKLLADFKN